MYINDRLSWDVQCDKLCSNVAGKISVLHRIFCRLKNTLKLLYEKTIQPVFDNACSVWCHTQQSNISKLQCAQNYAAMSLSTLITLISEVFTWTQLGISYRKMQLFISVMMIKAINGLTTPYLTDSIVMASEAHDRNTRLTNSFDVHVQSHNSEILKRSFVYNGSVLWNSLRHEVKSADNVNTFKCMYKDMILVPSQWCS